MSTPRSPHPPLPHSPADLALAPVLIAIERNLEWLRTSDDIDFALALDLNDDDSWYRSGEERARRVMRAAIRDVDLHGWHAQPTADAYGIRVSHGAYQVSLMFGRRLTEYVRHEIEV